MRHTRLLLSFLFALSVGLPFVAAQAGTPSCNNDSGAAPIGCATTGDISALAKAISDFFGALTASQTSQNDMIKNLTASNKQFDDQQAKAKAVQDHAVKIAEKNQDTAIDAINKHSPTLADCAAATSQMIQAHNMTLDQHSAATIAQQDIKNTQGGLSDGQAQTKKLIESNVQASVLAAQKGSTSPADLANEPDLGLVAQLCPDEACYNTALDTKIANTLALAAGDKSAMATQAQMNGQIADYGVEWGAWVSERSEARTTIAKLLPKMKKHLDQYKQAVAAYSNANLDPNVLKTIYPGADKIGISQYELQEAEFAALTASGQTLVAVGQDDTELQRASQRLQSDAAQLQINKMERDAFAAALKQASATPPPPPTGGISSGTKP